MADTQNGYRAWPTNPPTYHAANSDEVQRVTANKNWNDSLGDCCSPGSLCLTTCFLPCPTFGKTQGRIQNPKLDNYNSCNGECAIFTLLAVTWTHWMLQYGIEGSCCGYCWVTFWCGCCALTQEEKEVELRTRPELAGDQMAPQMAYPK
ncbi:PLAC8 family protein [Aspergillus ibericus CBS 121593]|uniref:PLAC8-domain-containing protein n=1 Tax=Aspergillus ibericus CBS 121593 TaxID=1448316 RepID=A0A395GU49_9EURO|nr:hypothetical protein BO80DRAFT_436619 [Aspergillus ibericus CBS 121593]RAK98704.1 hypothetical protein BO80DRAFT_436619 [Aspergillus ibericus CBS 121593]